MSKPLKLILSVVVCLAVGIVGSVFTSPAIPTWYMSLNKPIFNPPNWIFGPVWSLLYILMGISFYMIWEKRKKNKNAANAIKLFAVQLVLNAVWSPIFFGAKNLFLSLIVIIFMWFAILKTIRAFAKVNKTASYLLYPYIAWVSFASVLNFSIWMLNK